jgi:SRSO17 transposase
MATLKRKSIEPIALAAGVAVRTLQEFLAFFAWDHRRMNDHLQRRVADRYGPGIGVFDPSAHPKRGTKTPGVQRQWCGQKGRVDNCVVGQHLLFTNNDSVNAFSCVLASDLYLPEAWAHDRRRCREAGVPDELGYRPIWQIALDQLREALGNGVQFSWVTFDEEHGNIPAFWFGLDALGQRAIGEVKKNFCCWTKRPACRSWRHEHTPKRVDEICARSRVFVRQPWRRVKIKDTTRGTLIWEVKAARVHLVRRPSRWAVTEPTDRQYWLIVARHPKTGEVKYFVSNASAKASLKKMLRVAFARWRVEKWYRGAKQDAGFGAFEVRNYTSLIRHWLCSRMVMLFLAEQTHRLRGEKSADHAGAGSGGRQPAGGRTLAPMLVECP